MAEAWDDLATAIDTAIDNTAAEEGLTPTTGPPFFSDELAQALWSEDWIAPTLINNWVNFGGSYITAGYRLDAFSMVHIRGFVKSGTNAIIFVLPTGYRPPAVYLSPTSVSGAVGGEYLEVYPSGNVAVGAYSATWTTINFSFSIY